jgi:hypothetical protein
MTNNTYYTVSILIFLLCSCDREGGRATDNAENERLELHSTVIPDNIAPSSDPANQLLTHDSCLEIVTYYLIKRQLEFSELIPIPNRFTPCFNKLFRFDDQNTLVYQYGFKNKTHFIHCLSSETDSTEAFHLSSWNQSMKLVDTLSLIRRALLDGQMLFRSQIKWHPIDGSNPKFFIENYTRESAKLFEHPDMMVVESVDEYYIDFDGRFKLIGN